MTNATTSELRAELVEHLEDMADSLDEHVTHDDIHRLLLEALEMARGVGLDGEEFVVMHYRYPDEPHRGPFPMRAAAQAWVDEAAEDGFPAHVFYVASRKYTSWEKV